MIEEIISLYADNRPKFTVNNAVTDVQIFPGDFSFLQGGDQSFFQTKFFAPNDNIEVIGYGARCPYCFGTGQDVDLPSVQLIWRNENLPSDPQLLADFKIPFFGREFPTNQFSPFHGGAPTTERNTLNAIIYSAGTSVSMLNVPAAIPNGTILRLDLWVRIRHNLPMEA
jgi:hypothetical protein